MAELVFAGMLNLSGLLKLAADGGMVMVKCGDGSKAEVLVADPSMQTVHGKGVAVTLPPSAPQNAGLGVCIVSSFNAAVSIKVGGRDAPIVALGSSLQGDPPPLWPGMVLPSVKNTGVLVNGVPANVKNDKGMTFPNGGTNVFNNSSGQA